MSSDSSAGIPSCTARCDAGFRARLSEFSMDVLEQHTSTIFAVSEELELLYFNPAYWVFSIENGGAPAVTDDYPIGSNLLDAIDGDAKLFYRRQLEKVLSAREPWHHEYVCSTPELYREFRQSAYPLASGRGILLVNSLKVCEPMKARAVTACAALEHLYRQATGFITQCSNCRRSLRNDGSEVWDWVPGFIEARLLHTSHSICPFCFEYFWKPAL